MPPALQVFILLCCLVFMIWMIFVDKENKRRSAEIKEQQFRAREFGKVEEKLQQINAITKLCEIHQGALYYDWVCSKGKYLDKALKSNDVSWQLTTAKSFLNELKKEKNSLAARKIPIINTKIPTIKCEIENVEIKSKFSDNIYYVDLKNMKCSCCLVDYELAGNSRFEDLVFICRHTIVALKQNDLLPELTYEQQIIASLPHKDHFYSYLKFPPDESNLKVLMGYSVPLDWLTIIVINPDDATKTYGFNIKERRWSYSDSPKGNATKIRTAIRKTFDLI